MPACSPTTRASIPPARQEIEPLPVRGKPLRDKLVLRLIAIDRALHFLVLGLIGAAILIFAANRDTLRGPFYRVVVDLQTGASSSGPSSGGGLLHEIERAFSLRSDTLQLVAHDLGWAALQRRAPEAFAMIRR